MTEAGPQYWFVRILAGILTVIGVLSIGFGALLIVAGSALHLYDYSEKTPMFGLSSLLIVLIVAGGPILYGLFVLAFAQLLQLAVAIESNTRQLVRTE